MHKLTWIAVAALAAVLTAAGIAVAAKQKGISQASASFTTNAATQTSTKTCSGADGHYTLTNGVYTGTGTGDLAGNVQLRFHAIVNTDKDLGLLKGKLVVRAAQGNQLVGKANVLAVVKGSNVSGFVTGRVREAKAELLGNFSGTWSGNALNAQLGAGSATNTALLYAGTGCGKTTQSQATTQNTNPQHGNGKEKGHKP